MQIRLTRAVKGLVIACFAAFFIQQTADQFFGGNILSWFGLIPAGVIIDHRFWQVFTYAFLHGDVMHLFLNMVMLVFIGSELEALWGIGPFLRYYFFCSISAGVLYLLMQVFVWGGEGLHTPMVGASGAIYGLLMAYGLIFGERVLLFMMLFPMKAKFFVWILAGIEFMTSVYSGRSGGLSSIAHLGGMAAGFCYLWVLASIKVAKKRRQAGLSAFNFGGVAGRAQLAMKKHKLAKLKKSGHLKLVKGAGGNPSDSPDSNDSEDSDPKTWH